MPATPINLISSKDLCTTFTKRFFAFRRIAKEVEPRRPGTLAALQKLLQPLMTHIEAGELSKCEPVPFSEFMETLCTVLRLVMRESDATHLPAPAPLSPEITEYCIWILSLSSAAPITPTASLIVAGTFIQACLIGADQAALSEPQAFLQDTTLSLAPLKLPQSDLDARTQYEFVLYFSAVVASGRPAPEAALVLARQWCLELTAKGPISPELRDCAKALGVAVQESPPPKEPLEPPVYTPAIFDPPGKPDIESSFERCLTLLLGLPIEDVLEKETVLATQELNPDTPQSKAANILSDAAWDIWASFWTNGKTEALAAGRQFARFVYAVHSGPGGAVHKRSEALHLFLNFQLPDLIRAAALQPIRDDAPPLFRSEKCNFNPRVLLAGIVMATAGSCRAAERAKEIDDRESLLMLHGEQLRQVHQDYEKISKERNTVETEAWRYLAPLIAAVRGEPEGERPVVDANLIRLVNRGNHGDVLAYITNQLDSTHAALERKLTRHRLSGDHLMQPSGKINNPQGQGAMPAFETGVRLMKANEFDRAAAEFEEIASNRRVGAQQQNISRDFQAYCLARVGKFIQAKPLLRNLCDANYRFPAPYWNIACIETERKDQLSALCLGLERAPHLNMLEAVVYLGVVLDRHDDEQACNWLALTPILEALMLQYSFEARRLDQDDKGKRRRDDLLKRIAAYIDHGDPEGPDPTDSRIAIASISDLRDSLKQRDHPEVIGFWLRCHRRYEKHFKSNKDKKDYHALRTDCWEDLGRPDESATSFLDELEDHLFYFEFLVNERGLGNVPRELVVGVRTRIERQLRNCMSPDLVDVGRKIYRRIQEWESYTAHDIPLLLDGPPQRKLHEVFGGGVETLERVLIRVSGELRAHLHDISHYERQKAALQDVLRAFDTAPKPQCAIALRTQMQKWDALLTASDADTKMVAALQAQEAFGPLKGAFEREMTREEFEVANGVLHAINRVNARHIPGPKITVVMAPEAALSLRPDGALSSFSVRVSTETGSAEARLLEVSACVRDTKHAFALRDNLDVLPVVLRPRQAVLLSFAADRTLTFADSYLVEFVLKYDYVGQVLQTPAIVCPIETTRRSFARIASPYIHHREIPPEDSERCFFGRDEEKKKIIKLLTGKSERIGYIEGIRRTGKTSLFNSIRHDLALKGGIATESGPQLLPVKLKGASLGAFSNAGQILHFFLSDLALEPHLYEAGVIPPSKDECCDNMMNSYRAFEEQLLKRLPGVRVVAFWDEFTVIVDLAQEVAQFNPAFLVSTRALLEIIRDQHRAASPIVWLLAGFRALIRFIHQLPKVNLWAEAESIPIDFLSSDAVRDLLVMPLTGTAVSVTLEAVARVYQYTQGYPEAVQWMAELMLDAAQNDGRNVLTPADADAAALVIGKNQSAFADTWCHLGEISSNQHTLIGSFINVVREMGGRIEPHRLVGGGRYDEATKREVDDLVTRKILVRDGATVGIKAPLLEMWMRNSWKDEEPPLAAAVFIDLANLTGGTGSDKIDIPGLDFGDVVPGQFKLKTVLDAIDQYAADLTPTPVTEKHAVNYPPGSIAVQVLDLNQYHVVHVPKGLFEKARRERGSDDITLMSTIAEVTSDRPALTHVVLVTGDKDLKIVGVELQLKRGKSVHILTWKASAADELVRLARQYPLKCKLVYLEDLVSSYFKQRLGRAHK